MLNILDLKPKQKLNLNPTINQAWAWHSSSSSLFSSVSSTSTVWQITPRLQERQVRRRQHTYCRYIATLRPPLRRTPVRHCTGLPLCPILKHLAEHMRSYCYLIGRASYYVKFALRNWQNILTIFQQQYLLRMLFGLETICTQKDFLIIYLQLNLNRLFLILVFLSVLQKSLKAFPEREDTREMKNGPWRGREVEQIYSGPEEEESK